MRVEYGKVREFVRAIKDTNPAYAGDVLTFRSRTKDVFDKQGKRGGKMLFIVGETEFRNQQGEVVAYSRNTVIETEGPVVG